MDKNPYQAPETELEPRQAAETSIENPFKSVWFRPRETVRHITQTDPSLHVLALVSLAGIGNALDRSSSRNSGEEMSIIVILLASIIIAPLVALIGLFIFSHCLKITGNWLGGEGNREFIKSAIGWSSVPTAIATILWIPLLLLIGQEMFTELTPKIESNMFLAYSVFGIAIIQVVLAIWSFVILCMMIAEVQAYKSAWRGFGNVFLAGLLIIVPIVLLVIGAISLSSIRV